VNPLFLMYPLPVFLRQQIVPKNVLCGLIAALCFILLSTIPAGAEILGRVVKVYDGDTLDLVDADAALYRVRLQGIDAPEKDQAFSNKSREALSDLVSGKEVKVVTMGKDQYERYLGHIYVSGVWINRLMIRRGMAWHYKSYSKDLRLAFSELYARYKRIGLWEDENPLAPWSFRRNQNNKNNSGQNRNSGDYWLNTSTGVRHNKTCKHFTKTRKGRFCGPDEGRPCGECGG
jgi:endonuclease YncB( thermonuclease family)